MIIEFIRKVEVRPGKFWSKGQRAVFDREVGTPFVQRGEAIEVDTLEKPIVIKQSKAKSNNK